MTLLYITNANLPNYFMRKISVIYTIDHRCQHTNDRTIRDLALVRSSARAKKPFDSSSSIGLPTTMHTHTHKHVNTLLWLWCRRKCVVKNHYKSDMESDIVRFRRNVSIATLMDFTLPAIPPSVNGICQDRYGTWWTEHSTWNRCNHREKYIVHIEWGAWFDKWVWFIKLIVNTWINTFSKILSSRAQNICQLKY